MTFYVDMLASTSDGLNDALARASFEGVDEMRSIHTLFGSSVEVLGLVLDGFVEEGFSLAVDPRLRPAGLPPSHRWWDQTPRPSARGVC